MQTGGVGQTSGKDMWVRETTTVNQWQPMRAKGSYGKGFKASKHTIAAQNWRSPAHW